MTAKKRTQKEAIEFVKTARFSVLRFSPEGRRLGTYSGLNALQAAEDAADAGLNGVTVLVVPEGILSALESCNWELSEIREILKTKKEKKS